MRSKVMLALLLFLGVAGNCQNQASPYTNSVFKAQNFTTTGQTGPVIQLNGLVVASTVGSSYASLTITLAGTSLTTVTFAIQGSSDNGITFFPLPIYAVASPVSPPTLTVTATANGLYQVNSAGLTHVRAVTSGTFTATTISLTFTGSPNALISRSSSGGGGASTPATTRVYKGTGSVNGVTAAAPGVDYVLPTGTVAAATTLAGTPQQCGGATPVATGIAPNGDANCAAAGGTVVPSPQFRMSFFPTAGTVGAVQGDAGSTTDGNGSVTHSSVTTGNHTMSGFFDQNNTNVSLASGNFLAASHRVTSNSNAPADAFGNGLTTGAWILANNWGVGKNTGNAFGNGADGWRTLLGLNIDTFGGSSGIHQAFHLNPFVHGSGDSAAIYVGNGQGFSPCMWIAASDEGCVGININGTQLNCIATGTITSTTGTGDRAPVFNIAPVNCNGAGQLINDGIIIDTSLTTLHTALTGTVSAQWETNPQLMGSLAVTPGTAVLSTGIGVLTTAISQSTAVDANGHWTGAYQTQSFSSTIHDSLPLAVGHVFMANGGSTAEQCDIISISGSPTQTGTISCAKAHPIGGYIFQNGTQGFGDFDDDIIQNSFQHSVLYVLGATDTSHLIIAQRQAGGFIGQKLPYRGSEPAGRTLTGGFTVHPGALCSITNFNNTACTLESNNIAWAVGHGFASPAGIPTLESLGEFSSSQSSPDSPQSGGAGLRVNFNSITQHSFLHPFVSLNNLASLSKYANSGTGTGWLSAPPAIDVQGATSNIVQFDMALPSGPGPVVCGGATIICYKNSLVLTPQMKLFADQQGPENIFLDGANSQFVFNVWGIKAPSAAIGSVTADNLTVNLAATLHQLAVSGTTINPQGVLSFGTRCCATDISLFDDGNPLDEMGFGVAPMEERIFLPSNAHFSFYSGGYAGTEIVRICNSGTVGAMDIGNSNCTAGMLMEIGTPLSRFIVDTTGNVSAPSVATASASLVASSTAGDVAVFNNTTGHIADSGIPSGALASVSASNSWSVAQNLPSGSQIGSKNICLVDGTNCPSIQLRLLGTTGSVGGSPLTAGTCVTTTASVTGAVVGRTVGVSASDGTLPDPLVMIRASVTATNTVTVAVCAIAAVTPVAVTYNVSTY